MGRCHNCGQELIEIDNRGERLTGCLTCNLWAGEEGKRWIGFQWKISAPCTSCDMADIDR